MPRTNSGIHLENNTITDSRISAITFNATAPDPSDAIKWNTIIGNTIRHSHRSSFFYTSDGIPYGGGMLDFETDAHKVWVQNN